MANLSWTGKNLGRGKEFKVNIHATFARTKKPDGCKMGKGKGAIKTFVARVPEGKAMFTIPQINPLPGIPAKMYGLKVTGDLMPMPCRLREQNNHFSLGQDKIRLPERPTRKFEFKRTFATAGARNEMEASTSEYSFRALVSGLRSRFLSSFC